jgi:hypothetical protein
VEYSTNQGATWKPVIYMIERGDILTNETSVDALATLNAEHADVARYVDNDGIEHGGTYGAFIKAPIDQALAPFISGRIDDDSRDSKRIEIFPLPDAAKQPAVRFRFFHAGTDSWYFGIDNFGLYSQLPVERPTVLISKTENTITVTVQGGGTVQKSMSLSNPNWQDVPFPTGSNSISEPATGNTMFYRAISTP